MYSKYKTHWVIATTQILTRRHLIAKLNTNQLTTKSPQFSHLKNFASMDRGRESKRKRRRPRSKRPWTLMIYCKINFGGQCNQPWPDDEGGWAESPATFTVSRFTVTSIIL